MTKTEGKQVSARARGLGRGLSALMDEMGAAAPRAEPDATETSFPTGVTALPVGVIAPNPHQPRRDFDPVALEELTESIRSRGVLQPILVRPGAGGGYEIVAGERRWRAAQRAGLHEIPAVIRPFGETEMFEAALIENVQRQDLNPMEEAMGYQRLALEFGMTQADISAAVGKSRSHVANLMRLAGLDPEIQEMVRDSRLSLGHAKLLVGLPQGTEIAREVVAKGLSVRQLEARLKSAAGTADGGSGARRQDRAGHGGDGGGAKDADTRALEEDLTEALGLAVDISMRSPSSGALTVQFSTLDQLDALIARLQGG
jgi:ParB family chromosome partitioning protein